jgi:hypothetical protein
MRRLSVIFWKNPPGDIISTNEGLLAFTGRSTQGGAFTPVNPATLPPNIKPGSSPTRVPAASVDESAGEDQGGTIVQRANGLLPSTPPADADQPMRSRLRLPRALSLSSTPQALAACAPRAFVGDAGP